MARKKNTLEGFTQDALVDFFVSNPLASPDDAAAHFKATPGYIYAIINSDLFRARLAETRGKIREGVVASVTEQMTGLLHLAVDRLTDTVERTGDPALLMDLVDMLSKRYNEQTGARGQKNQPPTTAVQNNFFASPEAIARARATLENPRPALVRDLQETHDEVLDVESAPVQDT